MFACSMRSLFVSAWKREIHRSFVDSMQNNLKIQTDMNFWIAKYHHCDREKGSNFCMLEVIFFPQRAYGINFGRNNKEKKVLLFS